VPNYTLPGSNYLTCSTHHPELNQRHASHTLRCQTANQTNTTKAGSLLVRLRDGTEYRFSADIKERRRNRHRLCLRQSSNRPQTMTDWGSSTGKSRQMNSTNDVAGTFGMQDLRTPPPIHGRVAFRRGYWTARRSRERAETLQRRITSRYQGGNHPCTAKCAPGKR